jgi:glutathione S-transferase|tara:strand:- start:119 stop:259 length:141 start_codon:yes stop_codon:yes gene_type:complete
VVSPLGKVLALIAENGLEIFDSPLICEYLNHLQDTEQILPLGKAVC